MIRLGEASLATLPAAVRRPAYARAALGTGIVHLGLGAFMRGHLAAVIDDALDAGADPAWGVAGVSLRTPDTRDALAPQDGLYTLALRDAAGEALRVIGCVRHCHVAPEDPAAVVHLIAAPGTRIVSLTITEKGYLDAGPTGAIACLLAGLARRRAAGRGPLTLLSLDNLPGNGTQLRERLCRAADAMDTALARWIDRQCSCPNSMVDRIVPRSTDADRRRIAGALGLHDAWPVVAEPFFDWAVEDRFVAGRPPLPGVRLVADAGPWERCKLRMVNGAHSTIAYLGVAAGWPTVDEAMREPALRTHLEALLRDEIEPTLTGLDLAGQRTRLLARFANPALAHRCAQIAMDGSQKLPQRLLAPLRERLAAGRPIDRLALSVAAWWQHQRGHDDAGTPYTVDDPQAAPLQAHWRAAGGDADALTRYAPVFGDLAGAPGLVAALAPALRALREHGAAGTLARLSAAAAPP